ncbi:MAG: DUF6345 domain-containing protein [Deinococcales bacterium]
MLTRFSDDGVTIAFNHGEANAFEKDFVDPSKAGEDSLYVDDVDLAFYTGHASGGGIAFSTQEAGQFLFYDEVLWGNQDLEWLIIAACGPLQDEYLGQSWSQRWGLAFDGLHMIAAYSTVTYDNYHEGALVADYLLGYHFLCVWLGF